MLLCHNSPVERNALALPLTTITTMKNLIYSSNKVDFAAVKAIETPAPNWMRKPDAEGKGNHFPIAHDALINQARETLKDNGFTIEQEEHGLSEGNMNCFSGFALRKSGFDSDERQLVMGLRNSHNQKFAGSLAIGNSMLVCENLCFSSDVKLARRHTTHILGDLPRVLASAVARVTSHWQDMGKRINAYQQAEVRDAASMIVDLVDAKAFPARDIYKAVEEFRNPRHEEFKGGSLWTLYNSITENLKGGDLTKLADRTMRMQSIFDKFANHTPEIISQEDKESALVLPA